jgi:hypothetical protein
MSHFLPSHRSRKHARFQSVMVRVQWAMTNPPAYPLAGDAGRLVRPFFWSSRRIFHGLAISRISARDAIATSEMRFTSSTASRICRDNLRRLGHVRLPCYGRRNIGITVRSHRSSRFRKSTGPILQGEELDDHVFALMQGRGSQLQVPGMSSVPACYPWHASAVRCYMSDICSPTRQAPTLLHHVSGSR